MKPQMTGPDAVELLKLFEENNLHVWVDGGWGVDALIGHQTRPHEDLDIALQHKDVHKIRWLLGLQGYTEIEREDSRDTNFVLGDDKGHRVDVHTFTFDSEGNNIFGVPYRAEHLTGEGTIAGHSVNCIPPDVMMEFKTGYDIDEDDYHDVKELSEHFNLPIPPVYNKYKKKPPREAAGAVESTGLAKQAAGVVNTVKVDDYYIGDTGAAVLSVSGKVYTGVSIGGPLAVCAEQVALGAMVTAGERTFTKIVAVWKGQQNKPVIIPPCGRCREFMYQLHHDNLEATVILGKGHEEKLDELLPLAGWHPEPLE